MWGTKTTESKRYYYSNDGLFEKSLDVYKPVLNNSDHDNDNHDDDEKSCRGDLPVVLLVVGSGWVGHRAFIYAQTSWWNSSGPNTIASLGCTCVCIRHRGAFCVLPSATVMGQCLVLVLATSWAMTGACWDKAFGVTLLVALIVALIHLGGRGSASFDDMLEDVAQALEWVHNNQDLLRIQQQYQQQQQPTKKVLGHSESSSSWMDITSTTETTSATASFQEFAIESSGSNVSSDSESDLVLSSPTRLSKPNIKRNHHNDHNDHHRSYRSIGSRNSNHNKSPSFVFGGYSSGGHVAATLMHHPELFEKHNLPLPEKLFQGILMISGVMAVRPERVTVESTSGTTTIIETAQGPRWLTDLVVRIVWGPDFAEKLPSPLVAGIVGHNDSNNDNTPSSLPRLPHLLVGNRNELFGLSWLDVFFCSRAYCDKVRAMTGQPAKYVQVESDHWNILNSKVLHDTLQDELPKLIASS